MLFSVLLAVVLSRYYASTWAMLFVLGARPPTDKGLPGRGSWAALLAGAVLLALNAGFYAVGNTTAAYFVINYAMYTLFCVLCLGYLASDLLAWRRARRERSEPPAGLRRFLPWVAVLWLLGGCAAVGLAMQEEPEEASESTKSPRSRAVRGAEEIGRASCRERV